MTTNHDNYVPADSSGPHAFSMDEDDDEGRCEWCGDDEGDWKHRRLAREETL